MFVECLRGSGEPSGEACLVQVYRGEDSSRADETPFPTWRLAIRSHGNKRGHARLAPQQQKLGFKHRSE